MGVKRKQPDTPSKPSRDSDSDSEAGSDYDIVAQDSDVDIAAALAGGGGGGSDDDDASGDEDFIRDTLRKKHVKDGVEIMKQAKGKGKSHVKKGEVGGGSFQSMGLHPSLLRALTLRGYRTPTPIQRLTVAALLATPPRDLVGMARTGSGKTLAYMIPLVQRLGGLHSTTFGARALILIPTRELALQVLKVGKELARGFNAAATGGDHAGDAESSITENGKGSALRWGLVVGGEGMDDQFEMLTSNPDVIIATPGRLLHIAVEMNLDFRSIQYVVFDEADRLFEMGFSVAMTEILGRLPTSRQTLLFSATLPKSLVEFAKAGLQNPKLVRLDAESKISSDLRMAFFSVKQAEKDAALLVLLRDVIHVPLGASEARGKGQPFQMAPHQTIVFVATKHHVEYISNLLSTAGYAVSHIYGALDQAARGQQMDRFRKGITSVLVVTDVAARGIDIPVLENVVNYDFPSGSRVFVHRVGRTARAGRKGWAWSFVTNPELPYLLDLQLFLARPLVPVAGPGEQSYVETLVLGPFAREAIDQEMEFVGTLEAMNTALPTLREVMAKGQRMYERSQGKASQASYKRAKEMTKDPNWPLAGSTAEQSRAHPILAAGRTDEDAKKAALLAAVSSFKPAETVFELGSRGKTGASALMKDRRKALAKAAHRAPVASAIALTSPIPSTSAVTLSAEDAADEDDIQAVFGSQKKLRLTKDFKDSEFYMSYAQKDAATEKGYSLRDGASFTEQAQNATFDLVTDEGGKEQTRLRSQLKWDRKKKKFVKGSGEGADNVKIIKTESGTRLPATYRTGRFEEWKKAHRTALPRVGEQENKDSGGGGGARGFGKRFKHTKIMPSKPLDRLSKNFERKSRKIAKRDADGGADEGGGGRAGGKTKVASKFKGGKAPGRAKQELKSAEQIRKTRQLAEQRRQKNARAPGRGRGKGKGGRGRH